VCVCLLRIVECLREIYTTNSHNINIWLLTNDKSSLAWELRIQGKEPSCCTILNKEFDSISILMITSMSSNSETHINLSTILRNLYQSKYFYFYKKKLWKKYIRTIYNGMVMLQNLQSWSKIFYGMWIFLRFIYLFG